MITKSLTPILQSKTFKRRWSEIEAGNDEAITISGTGGFGTRVLRFVDAEGFLRDTQDTRKEGTDVLSVRGMRSLLIFYF
jgi:hypothetical protein